MSKVKTEKLQELLESLGLSTAAEQMVPRLTEAGFGDAVAVVHELLQLEVQRRQERRADRLRRASKLPPGKTFATLDVSRLPKPLVSKLKELARGEALEEAVNILCLGLPGVGKTHLSIALGVAACQAGYNVRFFRGLKLFKRPWASLADDTLQDVLDELAKPALLICDEIGNSPRTAEQDFAGVFYELVARRHRRSSFMLTTNLGYDQWHSALGSPFQVTPAVDRLIEGAHVITFPKDAPSHRVRHTDHPPALPRAKRHRRQVRQR
jgi:DNA replication protein DnaC